MANYVWTAKDRTGQTVVKEIQAETASEAKSILETQGYADLALKEEDIISAVNRGFPGEIKFLGRDVKITAEQRLKHRDNTSTNFLSAILNGVNQSKVFCILIIGLAVYQGYRGHWTSVWLLIGALLVWLVFLACVSMPLVYYHKLIRAADWSRWDEVLSLVETSKAVRKFSITGVPETELIRYRAKAMAGQGQLNEALAEYKQCEGRPDCPSWLYKLFLASLYTTAKDYDKAIGHNLSSITEKPSSTAWLDLANRYARYKRDPIKAREAMTEVDKCPLPDLAIPFRTRCLGIISYLEGDYGVAKRDLETVVQLLDKAKSRPFRDGHLAVTRAYLACVFAKQGDLPAAKKFFGLAKEYLVATKENELLAECCQLVGERP